MATYRQYLYEKTAAPTVNDDSGDGYVVGDVWLDTTNKKIYQAIDVTAGAAVWVQTLTPEAETQAYDIFRVDNTGVSTFVGTINGAPSGTSVVYNVTSGNENAMVPTSTSQLAKLRLYNTTRGNNALISNCNTGTNTITLTANAPANWVNGDVITIASQTVSGDALNWVDLELTSGPLGRTNIFIFMFAYDSGASNIRLATHPFTASYSTSKRFDLMTQTAGVVISMNFLYTMNSNIITATWGASGAATGIFGIRETGYLR